MATCKSITAYVQIATRDGKMHEKFAEALCVLFRDGTVRRYAPDDWNGVVRDAMGYQLDLVGDDIAADEAVPIIATYDARYVMSLSWESVCHDHAVLPTAKSPSDIYSLKLYDGRHLDAIVFDMKHVMTRGLAGTAPLVGLRRDGTAETDCRIMGRYYEKLTDQYQLRDAERGDRLGVTVMTLTGLARHEVKLELSPLSYTRRHKGGEIDRKLGKDYALDASREAAGTYEQYAMRRACMRGGLTFLSAPAAGVVHGRTVAIDETSAYHAQVMCRYVPEDWKPRTQTWLQAAAERVVRKTPDAVLQSLHMPFIQYFHMQVRFDGLRLRPGSLFEELEIGVIGTSRLYATSGVLGIDNESAVEAERAVRSQGYGDEVVGGRYAFAKIMEAESLTTWVTEQELWCIAQAYSWDHMTAIQGEGATKRKRPDDLSVLTSMHFWREKQSLKARIAGESDEQRRSFLEAVYRGEVKPKFNAVGYGLHARDEYRPGWKVDRDGNWELEDAITPEDFDERRPSRPKAWLVYGMRIAGGARMHLILAMILVHRKLGDQATILAGDTDSLKIRTDVPVPEIMEALRPLHETVRTSIDRVTSRAWALFGERCDPMDGLGEFEVEGVFDTFYAPNIKQYCSLDKNGRLDLTLAGVPRTGETSYAAWLRQMVERYGVCILPRVFTWGVTLDPSVSCLSSVDYTDVDGDRLPRTTLSSYTLGDPLDPENHASILWQKQHDRKVPIDGIAVCSWRPSGPVFIYQDGEL